MIVLENVFDTTTPVSAARFAEALAACPIGTVAAEFAALQVPTEERIGASWLEALLDWLFTPSPLEN